MTSRKLFANLLKESSKRRLWPIALSIAASFFAQVVYALIMFGHYESRLEAGVTNINDIRIHFYNKIGGLGNEAQIFVLCVLAFILAIQGYSYLFDSKQMDLYYSLPVKRETLFDANNLCGILIFAIPYLICNLITVLMGLSRGYVTLNTILLYPASAIVVILMFVMCYELCCLAAALTGHVVVGILGCLTFFFGGPVITMVIEVLMSTFLSSYYSRAGVYDLSFTWSPINLILKAVRAFQGDAEHEIAFYSFDAAPGVIKIFALAIGSYLIARILIKKRPAEAAGKSMAFSITKPIFKIIVSVVGALGAGILMYYIAYNRNLGLFVFGIICGLIVIHIVMETIYEFDFKACLKSYGSLIVSTVISLFIFAALVFDIFGYETWQPMPSRVESVAIGDGITYSQLIAPNPKTTSDYFDFIDYQGLGNGTGYALCNMKLTNLEEVEKITRQGAINAKQIHKDGLKYNTFSQSYIYYDYNDYDGMNVHPDNEFLVVQWNLKGGRKVQRRYRIDMNDEELLSAYRNIYNSEEFKKGKFPVYGITKGEIKSLKWITMQGDSGQTISEEDANEFVKAYAKDISAQTFDDLNKDTPAIMLYGGDSEYSYDYYGNNRYNFYVFPSFTNTIAFMEKHNMPTSWWDKSEDISTIKLSMQWWDVENDHEMHSDWTTNEKSEIETVVKNIYPSELFDATGRYDLNEQLSGHDWTNVEIDYNIGGSTYSNYVYLLDSDSLPEQLKTLFFE